MAEMSMNKVIHAAFRRDLQRFLDALAAFRDGDAARADRLGKAWDNFDAQLTEHHRGEHEIAWPAMRSIGVTDDLLAVLDSEHDRMAEALAGTRTAMATFRSSATKDDAAAARAAMEHLQEVTVAHLDHEERETEPVYLQHADGPEMKAMGKQFAKVSPSQGGTFFAWVTDGAGTEEMHALDASVPKPVRKVLVSVFGRGYRRDVAPAWRS
jgi:hypothetical protein